MEPQNNGNKPEPRYKMPVTWIDPQEDYLSAGPFVQKNFVERFGKDGLEVDEIFPANGDGLPVVSLLKYGKPLMDQYEHREPDPSGFDSSVSLVSTRLYCSWYWLKPAHASSEETQ